MAGSAAWMLGVGLLGLGMLAGCKDDDSSSGNDKSDTHPYLTDAPTASPSTVTDGDEVTYTIYATSDAGEIESISVNLSSFVEGGGFNSQANAELEETGTDTWTGTGTTNYEDGVETENGYYVSISLVQADGNARYYSLPSDAESQNVKMTYSDTDESGAEIDTGNSKYKMVVVDFD
jgi:hypothetical protein